ncbi:MAG: FadR family transcriptional regulator [Silicimonas sp.]|nr:FadR family transcriptional regulator [Silicimonas sp.]MBT8425178.1 FadR family transcriptional regulator [Silicimonas sp.]NND18799.1 FadR family transcriptional regulator [Silicimonas sp.]NND40836.1 FadR family transcriptional regulator [Silicimonas sp.]NNL36599.1 FadR family transcriptional regulator [Silicimonas sp.]
MAKQPTAPLDIQALDAQGSQPVSEMVVNQLLGFVQQGKLKPGDKLPTERELAQRLQVSRPSVREALRGLSILGVLEIRHGGGVFVSSLEASALLEPLDFFVSLSSDNAAEVFDARIQFEPMTAAMSAERLSQEDLDRLAEIVAAQRAAPEDAELFHDTDVEFHKILMDGADNVFLSRFGKMLQLLGDQSRRVFQKRKSVRLQSIEDHEAVFAALADRDPQATYKAMRQHMVNVRNALREVTGV